MEKKLLIRNKSIRSKSFISTDTICHTRRNKNIINVLRWYPFKKNSSVLQITNKRNSISSFLYDKGLKLDLLKYNSNSFYRCTKKDKTISINLSSSLRKYDYIVVVGFLDFFDAKDDYKIEIKKIMKLCSSLIKKNGIVLIADDFSKIKQLSYARNRNSVIKSLFNTSECRLTKMYYLHLNIENCFEIFTDKALKYIFPSNINVPNSNGSINEYVLDKNYYAIYSKGDPSNMFWSYLLEFNNSSKENIDFVKISSNRFDKFALMTSIDMKNGFVSKTPLSNMSRQHVSNLLVDCPKNDYFIYAKYYMHNNNVFCDYIRGETLYQKFYSWLFNGDKEQIIRNIKIIKQYLYDGDTKKHKTSKKFKKVFGNVDFSIPLHWKKNQNIDIIASNIILSKNRFYLIDGEWCFDFLIPSEYILWRFIHHSLCEEIFTKKELFEDILNITKKEYDSFLKMELHFSIKYVGNYS